MPEGGIPDDRIPPEVRVKCPGCGATLLADHQPDHHDDRHAAHYCATCEVCDLEVCVEARTRESWGSL